jgi:peptide chain release factor subunit 1
MICIADLISMDLQPMIRELSENYDKESLNTFISVYINKKDDPKFLSRRESACSSLLSKVEADNFVKTMEMIEESLQKEQATTLAIFASHKYDFLRVLSLPIALHNSLVVDTSPYIRPLARIQDEFEDYTLVVMDSHQARIYAISLGVVEQQKSLSEDIMNKHKKGGWSQQRFQRLRRGAIHKFYTEVLEFLEKSEPKQIILAGPGTAKQHFTELMPQHLQQKIIATIDSSFDDNKRLLSSSLTAMRNHEQQEADDVIEQIKSEIFKDGLAVYGLEHTLQAAQQGKIDILVVEKDYKLKGCICEHCQLIKAGPIKDCPLCGQPTSEADVIEEIIEFAERTDATVEFTEHEELQNLGHIAALLRF